MPYRRGSSSGQKGKGGLPRDVQVSKAMSLTLRHRAASDGLKMDKNGYVNVAELVSQTSPNLLASPERIAFSRSSHENLYHVE